MLSDSGIHSRQQAFIGAGRRVRTSAAVGAQEQAGAVSGVAVNARRSSAAFPPSGDATLDRVRSVAPKPKVS
jgi:hypothetical protein